jgi:hypothetical protein
VRRASRGRVYDGAGDGFRDGSLSGSERQDGAESPCRVRLTNSMLLLRRCQVDEPPAMDRGRSRASRLTRDRRAPRSTTHLVSDRRCIKNRMRAEPTLDQAVRRRDPAPIHPAARTAALGLDRRWAGGAGPHDILVPVSRPRSGAPRPRQPARPQPGDHPSIGPRSRREAAPDGSGRAPPPRPGCARARPHRPRSTTTRRGSGRRAGRPRPAARRPVATRARQPGPPGRTVRPRPAATAAALVAGLRDPTHTWVAAALRATHGPRRESPGPEAVNLRSSTPLIRAPTGADREGERRERGQCVHRLLDPHPSLLSA